MNALIIVWRESLEAMLVIGVLLAWIARQPQPAPLRRWLWLGAPPVSRWPGCSAWRPSCVAGPAAGPALEAFQVGMLFVRGRR